MALPLGLEPRDSEPPPGRPGSTNPGDAVSCPGEWSSNFRYCASAFAEANRGRNRTAKLGNRDKRDQLPGIGPELAVSGSDSAVALSQDPATTRGFPGWSTGSGCKVSATADCMAERVGFEPTVLSCLSASSLDIQFGRSSRNRLIAIAWTFS